MAEISKPNLLERRIRPERRTAEFPRFFLLTFWQIVSSFGFRIFAPLDSAQFTIRRRTKGTNFPEERKRGLRIILFVVIFGAAHSVFATTKGLSQIVTPDLQPAGDLSTSFQRQSEHIANPYQLQAEMGLTPWAEAAIFKGFKPNELIFGTEFGLLTKEPFLLSIGFVNWSPHSHVDPQPFIEAGYYTEHHKFILGGIHAGYRNEAILGYACDFNKTWRAQVDFQSGSGNSSTVGFTCNITRNFQVNPAIYLTNGRPHHLLGYVVFTYTFHLRADKKKERLPNDT